MLDSRSNIRENEFVPLAAFLHDAAHDDFDKQNLVEETELEAPAAASDCIVEDNDVTAEAVSAARRFRAAVADAVDAAVRDVLYDVACDVLGRELQLAPADLPAIIGAALGRCASETVLRVRVHSRDMATAARCGIDVVSDDGLRTGDVVIELRHGSIDARLGVRVAEVLAGR
jgi:hypothetical protein